jgi:hypothetical protein
VPAEDLEPLVDMVLDAARAAGRTTEPRLLTGYPRDEKALDQLVELGFSHLTVGIAPGSVTSPDDIEKRLRSLARRVGLVA